MILQTFTFIMALFATCILLGKALEFAVKGMKGLNTGISPIQYVNVSLWWGLFYLSRM